MGLKRRSGKKAASKLYLRNFRVKTIEMAKTALQILIAFTLTLLIPAFGWHFLGPLYAALFLIGYLAGFLLWLTFPSKTNWDRLKVPYWLTLAVFLLLHKTEENQMKFFETVSQKITGGTVPPLSAGLAIGLLVLPIGAWLIIPLLIRSRNELGYYSIWTFFASMGITELAHFFLPLLTKEPYGYFPGMASAVLLAPLAWWGISRMIK